MKDLLEKFTQIPAPPGYEKQIRDAVHAEIEPYADEIHTDALGNLIAQIGKSNDKGKRIMLAAHLDEIGVIATHIDEAGFIRFTNIGGVYPRYIPGGRVRFLDGTLGVIGTEKITSRTHVPPLNKMFIDIGANNQADCAIQIGDVATFVRPFTDLGNRMVSKAMDDRVGVTLLVETIKQLKETPHQIYFVFSVQEEVGVRGATTAAFGVNPDLGLAVDVTRTGDTPKGRTMAVSLGKGPAIKVKDTGMIADPRVVEWMVNTAIQEKLPYQLEVLEIGSTDARAIQLTRAGVPSGCVSIPCRYVHSPSEMVDHQDVQDALQLILALLKKPINLE